MTFPRSVVIGKFLPPHRGHHFLIDTAQSRSSKVTVIVCAKPTDVIPGVLRGEWLREVHSAAEVMVIDDRYDENDTAVWAANTIHWLGGPPDAVFTSEDYGEPYAKLMGAVHVSVDKPRTTVPCSATMIRSDPWAHWGFLAPPVRAWYARRVCVLGAESTGTTTLSAMLAEHFGTIWVPEYGREYSELKTAGEAWTTDEFVHIAREQARREDLAARDCNGLLICDTNAFATIQWHRRYCGFESEEVRRIADAGRCDHYFLTGDEIPFVQDGLRDGEHLRPAMHCWFETALMRQSVPWTLLRGSKSQRLRDAVATLQSAHWPM